MNWGNRLFKSGVSAIMVLTPQILLAVCKLPVPDGGPANYTPSKANLFGDIVSIELPVVTVRNGRTKGLEQISVSKISKPYSVYGGDAALTDLKPRMQVWVWFAECKRPKAGIPSVAYFEFFSTDPKDRAKLDRRGRIVSVPK